MQGSLFVVLFIVLVAGSITADDYLKEAPEFLKPCHIHGAQDGACLSRAIENIFTNWKDGIPGLKGVGSIDPFRVKKIRFKQRSPNLADIQVELTNVTANGLSKLQIIKTRINERDYSFDIYIKLPKLKITSGYKLKGRLLVLNLDGHGSINCEISDMEYTTVAKTNLRKVGDEYFFDVISMNSDVRKVGDFHVEFTNLFNGNKELEDSAHQLFNENWRELFQIMRPAISETLDAVTLNRYKRILNYIPARFVVDDLP